MAMSTRTLQANPQGAFDAVRDYLKTGELALAVGIMAILVVLLLPLPSWLLDISLSFSLTWRS
jgi:flagellar biosynthesis protein FlhA